MMTPEARRYSRRLLRRIRELLGDDPRFLPVVLRATPRGVLRKLSDSTELVIEGMPRSGNTFAVHAFEQAVGRPITVSSHVHTPSAVKAAVARRLPTLVVVRQPFDAVISLVIAAPHVRFEGALGEWMHHYDEIWPWRAGFVVATFDQVVADLGAVIGRVNERFGTDFARFEPTPENVAAVFATIEENHQRLHGGTEHVVPRPSTSRQAQKAALLEQACHPDLDVRWAQAAAVYEHYERLAKS